MKIDRLIGIISILLQQDKVTAPYLADKFEVSRRTINRDIEDICRSGIPIITEQGQNGGISIMSGYSLDRTALTSADMNAILTGLQSLDSVAGTKRYQQLMEKICAGSFHSEPNQKNNNLIPKKDKISSSSFIKGTGIYIDLASHGKTLLAPKIELIQKAQESHKLITFTYYSPRGETHRSVEPYTLIFWWASWYLWGYCNLRSSYRLFKLNRMTDLIISDNEFIARENSPTPEYSMNQAYPKEIFIKVKFSPSIKWRVIDDFGPEFFTEQNDGCFTGNWYFSDKENLFSWLLSYGPNAELLEPLELRIEFLNYVDSISKNYSFVDKV